ncbi:MAG: DUF86 domain-containing protein [Thermoanaerobaculia bacterium]|nr:DUF86 domain-containing protein [Thermoanaerobaculia bacterium]
MLDHAREAVELMRGKSRQNLDEDRLLQLSVVRLVEIVGEAAGRVTEPTQALYSHIPWSEIIGTRHRLIHGYDFVDYDILWQTIQEDLPVLIRQLEQILESGQN